MRKKERVIAGVIIVLIVAVLSTLLFVMKSPKCLMCGKNLFVLNMSWFNPSTMVKGEETKPTCVEDGGYALQCKHCGYKVAEVVWEKKELHRLDPKSEYSEKALGWIWVYNTCRICGEEVLVKKKCVTHRLDFNFEYSVKTLDCTYFYNPCKVCGKEVLARKEYSEHTLEIGKILYTLLT